MTARRPCPPAPGPLEDYAARFDDLFFSLAQRRGFREYLTGLLAPRERNKTITCLAGAEPVAGAGMPGVQRLQFFLSESPWEAEQVNERRLELLREGSATAPHDGGVIVIDDSGDRKDGTATAHVGRQWLGRGASAGPWGWPRLPVMNPAMTSGVTNVSAILDAMELTSDPELEVRFAESAHRILADLVSGGAALGWVEPPSRDEVAELLGYVVSAVQAGDAALRAAYLDRRLVGLGYWLRYARPTHRPHADLEKIAVDAAAHGRGVGRALTAALIADAQEAGIEVLTLDARGDNTNALHLYRSLGFAEYGRLPDFVAVGEHRYDKVFYMLDFRQQG